MQAFAMHAILNSCEFQMTLDTEKVSPTTLTYRQFLPIGGSLSMATPMEDKREDNFTNQNQIIL